jgi:AraC family transcriptional regulator
MLDILTADRGATHDHPVPTGPRWFAVSRLGNLQLPGQSVVLCLQMRGGSRVDAREGVFQLQRGDWVVFERDSAPQVQAGRGGLLLGITVPAADWEQAARDAGTAPLPGRCRLPAAELRSLLRLWRQGTQATGERRQRCLRVLLAFLAPQQADIAGLLARCPGRSQQRKLQVLARLQRTWLFLEGNAHRTVRLAELAELSNLSVCHFAKTFQSLYRESPLAANHRLRLERACRLLASTPLSVSDIGQACGFDSCCSFSRAFSNRYRQPPSRYRSAATAHSAVRLA